LTLPLYENLTAEDQNTVVERLLDTTG
jgi:hypothetical protein